MTYSTPLTLGTTYYNCPAYLDDFVKNNIDYVDHLIIVDDGSEPSKRASLYLDAHPKISLYEVTKDVGFNSHGSRNLIMKECQTDWCVLLDIDREFMDADLDWNELRDFLDTDISDDCFYTFAIWANPVVGKDPNELQYSPKKFDSEWELLDSPNDFIVNKKVFWSVGGYDEEIIGFRAGDRHFMRQMNLLYQWATLLNVELKMLRGPSEHNTTTRTLIKKYRDTIEYSRHFNDMMKIVHRRYRGIEYLNPNKPTLTFPWRKVF